MIRSLRRTLLLLVMASLAVGTAFAQENASITGTVTDPTGAVIPNATVILTNTATEHQQKSQANTDGIYIFGNLGVGSYSLSISAKGFTRTTIGGITVNAGQTVQENVSLKIGSTAQTITVQAGALELQTQTNELSTLMTGKQVSQLATNGRNVTAPGGARAWRLQQSACLQRRECSHLIQWHQLQWNPHFSQHLPAGWRGIE